MYEGTYVILTPQDLEFGMTIAARRFEQAQRMGLHNAHGLSANKSDSLDIGILGTLGELAVARCLGIEYTGDPAKDVGEYEVKTTDLIHGCLLVRPRGRFSGVLQGSEATKYILVIRVSKVVFLVVGWLSAGEIKQKPKYFMDKGNSGRPPAWFIPQSELHPMERLEN